MARDASRWSDPVQDRDQYVQGLKAQLEHWNEEIGTWQVKARKGRSETRADFGNALLTVREHRDRAVYQMYLLQSAAGEAWKDLVGGTDEAWRRMREAFDTAGTRFRPE